MKKISDVLRKAIAHKHLGKDMIGAITLNEVRRFFGLPSDVEFNKVPGEFMMNEPWQITIDGYVKFNKIFVKTGDQGIKIKLFKQKKEILDKVNLALENVGYKTNMVDIYIK